MHTIGGDAKAVGRPGPPFLVDDVEVHANRCGSAAANWVSVMAYSRRWHRMFERRNPVIAR
jgi:hypothetical protein